MEAKNQNIDLAHENLLSDSDEHTKILRAEKMMIISFIIIGAIFNLLFLILEKTLVMKGLQLMGLLMVPVNWLVYTRTGNFTFARHNMVFMGIIAIVPWLITGGPQDIGFIWIAPFVLWAFFLTGTIGGGVWIFITFLISVIIVILSKYGIVPVAYSPMLLFQIFMMSFLIGCLAYALDRSRRIYEKFLIDQKSILATTNVNLQEEIKKRAETEKSLQEQKNELEKMNKFMVDRELKMIALKKELSVLKAQQ